MRLSKLQPNELRGKVDAQYVAVPVGRKQNDHLVPRPRELGDFLQDNCDVLGGGIGPIGWLAEGRVVELEDHGSRVDVPDPGFGGEHVAPKRLGLRVHRDRIDLRSESSLMTATARRIDHALLLRKCQLGDL